MAAPALLVAAHQGLVIRLQEDDAVGHPGGGHLLQRPLQGPEEFPAPDVHHRRQPLDPALGVQAKLDELAYEVGGQVIHAKKPQIL